MTYCTVARRAMRHFHIKANSDIHVLQELVMDYFLAEAAIM